jgi:hypothetical protein
MHSEFSDHTSVCGAARVCLALLLASLLVFPQGLFGQEPAGTCNTGGWTASSVSLQNPMETFASAVATVNTTNYLYVVGGVDCNTATGYNNCSSPTFQTQVGHATLDPNTGAIGSFTWQNLWNLGTESVPVGLSRDLCGVIYTSPATNKNFIYTVGGLAYDPLHNSSALTNQIWYAQIAVTPNNGNVLAWHQAMKADGVTPITLPSALDLEGVAVLNGYLYVIGGSTNADPTVATGITDQVWSIQLNQNTGNLIAASTPTGFTSQPPILPPPVGATYTGGIYKTCPVAYPTSSSTGMIYVAGGQTNNGTTDHLTGTVEYVVQGTGGSLTDGNGHNQWGTATSLPNGLTLSSQAVVYNTGIVLMGGQDAVTGTQDTDNVYLGTIDSQTVIGWSSLHSLSTALTGNIERNAGATNGLFIYSLGGEVSHNGTPLDSSAIFCLKL